MSHFFATMVDDKERWEKIIRTHSDANFLQSYNWGKFHTRLGKKVFYLVLSEGESTEQSTPFGVALIVKETAKRGSYLTVAGGPIIEWENVRSSEYFRFFTQQASELAKKENCLFIRMRPQCMNSEAVRGMMTENHWVSSPMHLTADLTLQLDLTQDEESLLLQMRKNTRYEVRQAEKRGIVVRQSQNPEEIKLFYEHQLALAKRHNFVPFSYEFLYEQFLSFVEDDQVVLFHSFLPDGEKETLLASAFIIFYNGEAVYHYGISTPENDRQPGSYAAQWAAILEAKKRGCHFYNFWGIAPKEEINHRFAGVSIFKRGFGGEEVPYLPAHDLPVSWQYSVVKSFEKIRKKARNL